MVGELDGFDQLAWLVSRTGRYKVFLVSGPVLMLGGLAFLGPMGVDTGYLFAATGMLLVGFGIGVMMQNLVVIVQAQVPHQQLGVATSTTNYFRMIGASTGIAVFGSVFVSTFTVNLNASGVQLDAAGGGVGSLTPRADRRAAAAQPGAGGPGGGRIHAADLPDRDVPGRGRTAALHADPRIPAGHPVAEDPSAHTEGRGA